MRVTLLGCGWLGTALLSRFQNSGYDVKVSTTSTEKLEHYISNNIHAFKIQLPLHDAPNLDLFFDSDILIITVPFKRSFEDPMDYLIQIQSIKSFLQKYQYKKLIFTSSTSIYPFTGGYVDEGSGIDVQNPRSIVLNDVEQFILGYPNSVVLRLSGLFGPKREPTVFMKRPDQLEGGLNPVNLIHLDDCVGIIDTILSTDQFEGIYNAVSTHHPTRKEFYNHVSNYLKKPILSFKDNKKKYKIVSNFKLLNELQYQFRYPDPRDVYDITKKKLT